MRPQTAALYQHLISNFLNREKDMRMFALPGTAILGGILAIALNVLPAHAQATRTWVSGVGDDANPCSRTAPCKTFAGAISKTATGGEINCLDPGGFGGVTIGKALTIRCEVEAGVLVSGTNAIIVNGPNTATKVVLEGLDIEGLGTGLNGVRILSGRVTIKRSTIRNFIQSGVSVDGPSGNRVYIVDSLILNNAIGVNITGAAGSNFGTLVNTVVDSSTASSVRVSGGTNQVTLMTSSLSGAPAALDLVSGGLAVSIGPSNFLTGTGNPTSTQVFK
jgi:hypothetical protein